ncbi:MAG: L-aspartate oxidase [Planctomycetes bacterium]|nr:L-aspartate oxidase [Planctomycetota bacterium]
MKKHIEPRRYLLRFDSHELPQRFADVLVIGSGVAGLSAGLAAAGHGDVLLVSKDELRESNTQYAQGGVAAVWSEADSFAAHVADTLAVGQGLCDAQAVESIVREGPERIRELVGAGAQFDREGAGYNLTREGGHSQARILHAQGDATGAEIERTLLQRLAATSAVRCLDHTFVVDLLTDGGECVGALLSSQTQGLTLVWAKQTLLAAGGLGQLYRETTNPEVATGDGIAMAYRAGAVLADMEFVQFHPTTLYIAGASRWLLSETLRGEGAYLVNSRGERFMPRYHPDAELAPRDVVSRAIVAEMRATGATHVRLDLRHLEPAHVRERFPTIARVCAQFDLDLAEDLIPVRPSAHYMIGGVRVGTDARTTLPRLWACGECACSGLHGANRLGSNSLLEGLVLGHRAGHAAGRLAASELGEPKPRHVRAEPTAGHEDRLDLRDVSNSLKSLMWRHVGIERSEGLLSEAEESIDFWCRYVMAKEFHFREGWEVQNMLTLAKIITVAARTRKESRGVHFRSDFPQPDDANWKTHITFHRPQEG